ncbi:CHAT domain-containing protein [Nocardiopsis sp. EMB25]|uniref:CHAT domain-containing protein n=1 Tax=Nocardiopsis sp. EMB25 TaxID=2835867 RepID=UPI002283300D|nr:CHAT domain-containing protein [Nocardiopsis sp. EMB25]MCY9785159.1 CHAT domain-containing protein [Nocardiopsis sp. EMB25]
MGPNQEHTADPYTALKAAVEHRLQRVQDLEELAPVLEPRAVQEARQLIALARDNDDLQARFLLGLLHWYRYLALPVGQDREDLQTAIEMLTPCFIAGAASQLPEQLLPTLADQVDSSTFPLLRRVSTSTDLGLVATAVALWQDILDSTPTGHPRRTGRLANLGASLRIRFVLTGELTDLNEAVTYLQEAVDITSTDHPDRAMRLSNLGISLATRFVWTGELTDLNKAIQAGQEAVDITSTDHPDHAMRLSNLGAFLTTRFERTGELTDLNKAIQAGQEAVDITSTDHPDHARLLSNLGASLRIRFIRTGELTDLNKAVTYLQEAVDTAPTPTDRSMHLSDLGASLATRFMRTGELTDLNKAVTYLQEAVDTAPTSTDHITRAMRLSNLGAFLTTRFERTTELTDLNKAVTYLQEAVDITSTDHPDRAMCLSNLGASLRIRFERTGELTDLNKAVTYLQEAVDTAPTPTDRSMYLSNLGASLATRFERTTELTDLNKAIQAGQEAVDITSTDHPDRAMCLSNLGASLRIRFERTGELTDLNKAVTHFQEAVDVDVAAPSTRIRAARAASELTARAQPHQAAELLDRAVRLLPEVAPRHLERADQQYALGGFAGLAADAAALVLDDPTTPANEKAGMALRLLEAGRAVLLSQALHVRTDLSDLADRYSNLAARFIELRVLLDQTSDAPVPITAQRGDGNSSSAEPDRTVRDRRRLADEFADLLNQIRSLPGFESFARPPSIEELLAQTAHGAVVMFNTSRYRSDALLLTQEGITCLPLPRLPIKTVIDQVNAFHRALHLAGHGPAPHERQRGQRQLVQILGWLWDNATGPVLEALGHHCPPASDERWPRVWWAPGGLLGLLPVHAAGHYTSPPDTAARAVMDRVVSSYTPTVAALRHARQHPPDATVGRALIVEMPTTPGVSGRLDYVRTEANRLDARLPGSVRLTEPDPVDTSAQPASGSDGASTVPTREKVLNLLPTYPIAHFACHGVSDPTDPSRSRLLLHDHDTAPLTVSALAPVQLDHVHLAYLSACETAAAASTELIDEAIHLASAFQLAGYPHVIGTLWAINDDIAADLANDFYTALTTSTGNGSTPDVSQAARALHHAIRVARSKFPETPSLWAAYLHAGA